MFLILLKYIRPLDQVEVHLAAHREYLRRRYADGGFLMSGRMEPRTGGVILAQAASRGAAEAMMHEDPFYTAGVAEYTLVEFHPTMTAPALAQFKAH
ncbi:conserved hypothetical protein [Thiomonas sp. X19]|uniref:YciI family protein n=1 Tax=Thiomonas sp. X19 TaxID=1050370 RepID=UPI000B760889|nr:YciI family protein [Thiomonas sp. X19]SCC92089.1 conserved hypothetical protein [Thiomonas sp. X19]